MINIMFELCDGYGLYEYYSGNHLHIVLTPYKKKYYRNMQLREE
jgi:hypothetical protein